MPARRSRRLIAKQTPYPDQATRGPTQSEDPVLRLLLARHSTPLPQELPVSSAPIPSAPIPLLQPTIPLPATPLSVTPSTALTPVLLDPETLTSASRTSSQAILPSISSSSTLPPHFHGHGMFHMAQNFTISNSHFIDFSPTGFGLERLLKHSMPDAFYNSSARYPPPKCHFGTRKDYIDLVTKWALGESDRKEPILWMRGPFGVGKSAIAQSCAEALAPMNKLAATLFFSRSNPDRDDPRRVFMSIVYQIATKCPSFREIIARRMAEDPALAAMSLSTQFETMLIDPLREVDAIGSSLGGRVVVIDGLDECRGTAEQCEIVRIIAASVDKCTTPFRWFITSRPEDPIIRAMTSAAVSPTCSRIELPVSREIDHEILLFLTDEFRKIREDHGLPDSWPSEEALALLVEHGAGLWIYVATMVRFIKDENSYGPEDQLRIVVEFAKDVSSKFVENPLAEMDFFYTLIMQRVPSKLLTTVRKILLVSSIAGQDPESIADILCLSVEKLRRACAPIRSVMELEGTDLTSMSITFYHASFLDFMKDPQRSKELCIYGDFLIGQRQELLEQLHEVCSQSTDSWNIVFPSCTVLPEGLSYVNHYILVLEWFWKLCGAPKHPLDSETAISLAELSFGKMLRLAGHDCGQLVNAHQVRDNLPAVFCNKIVRKAKCLISGCTNTQDVWILGHGVNEVVPYQLSRYFNLRSNQNMSKEKCFCGAQRKRYHNL